MHPAVASLLSLIHLAPQATTAAAPSGGGPPSPMAGCGSPESLLLMAAIFAIFWFVVFRPQQKRMKEQQRFLDSLQKGQEVSTSGGLIGRITGFKGVEVILELQEKIRVRVLRSNISASYPPAGAQKAAAKAPPKETAPKDTKETKAEAEADKKNGSKGKSSQKDSDTTDGATT